MESTFISPELQENERLDVINENLRLIQKKDGLTFGTDAYLLAAFLRGSHRKIGAELGGGTGVISLLALTRRKLRAASIYEIQPEFADLCTRNAVLNGLEEQTDVICADVRDVIGTQTFDAVFSNPPYMKHDCGKENAVSAMNIARREVHGSVQDFCRCASLLLRHGGTFSVVYRPDRLADLLCSMRESSLEPKRMVFVYPSVADRPCLVLLEAQKGAASGMVVAPPLCIYNGPEKSEYTPEMSKIYECCSMDFLFPGTKKCAR